MTARKTPDLSTTNSSTNSSTSSSTKRNAFGEIVSSSITTVVAQVWQSENSSLEPIFKPRFGSFVAIESDDLALRTFGIVFNVITGSPDSVHKPWALGMTREQLRVEQPHIFSLLRTEVHAAVVGFQEGGAIYQNLPPQPPDVHDFVYPATVDEVLSMTQSFEFLRLLVHVTAVPADELLTATIREAHRVRGNDDRFLVSAGQALSNLMQNDYDRLISLLRKIKPVVAT
jgi:hypothetical protein